MYIGEPVEQVMDVPLSVIVTSASSVASTTIWPSDKSPETVYSPACVIVYTEPFCVTEVPLPDVIVNAPVISVL